jgi:hypothetical protein
VLSPHAPPSLSRPDYDHSAPFAKYRTYSLAPAAHGQTLSSVGEAALRAALRTQLAARGISEVPSGQADLAVARHVFLQEKVAVQQYTDWGYGYGGGWPYGYGYYGMWAGAPRTYVDVNQYTEGTLVLDLWTGARRSSSSAASARRSLVGRRATPGRSRKP